MCKLLHTCNFNKKYIIYDLPVFSAIHKFYLRNLGIKVLKPEEYFTSNSGVICITDINVLNQITENIKNIKSKLFNATWSLSETPIELRSNFKPLISNFAYYLIAYQQSFNEADNVKYFREIKGVNLDIKWVNSEIGHLENNYYLFGKNDENI